MLQTASPRLRSPPSCRTETPTVELPPLPPPRPPPSASVLRNVTPAPGAPARAPDRVRSPRLLVSRGLMFSKFTLAAREARFGLEGMDNGRNTLPNTPIKEVTVTSTETVLGSFPLSPAVLSCSGWRLSRSERCGFCLSRGHVQESANERTSKWDKKLMFLPLSPPSPLLSH